MRCGTVSARNPHVRVGVGGNRPGESGLNILRIEGGDCREGKRQSADVSDSFSDELVDALTCLRCPLRWDYEIDAIRLGRARFRRVKEVGAVRATNRGTDQLRGLTSLPFAARD